MESDATIVRLYTMSTLASYTLHTRSHDTTDLEAIEISVEDTITIADRCGQLHDQFL